jgi:hypothetical protein
MALFGNIKINKMIKLTDLLSEQPSIEIKNINFYQQVLDKSNGISISSRKYFQDIIDTIKKQNNLSSPRQFSILQRMKNGDFKYHPKN